MNFCASLFTAPSSESDDAGRLRTGPLPGERPKAWLVPMKSSVRQRTDNVATLVPEMRQAVLANGSRPGSNLGMLQRGACHACS